MCAIICAFTFSAQTGPGGIGNSSSNGLWLRADMITLSSGSSVSSWADDSGNGNDGFQSVAANEPTFVTNQMNGYPIVRLDGSGDQIEVADADILDNSGGLTYYVVIRPNNLNGNPRGILGKRTNFSTTSDYAYTWFFHGSNLLNVDLNTSNNRFDTGSISYSNSTNYILSLGFDGSQAVGVRASVYTNGNVTRQSTESSSTLINSSENLVLGALNVNYGQYLGADYAEVIQFNKTLNSTERIIVENYLSAKYDIVLGANDIYEGDENVNGDFDHDVAGIGQVSSSDNHRDSKGSGIIRISNPTDLNDDEFLFWGHDNGTLQATELSDVPVGIQGRFERQWKFSELNSSKASVDIGSIDIQFDLDGLGTVTASDLRLIIDSDDDGQFDDETPISGASHDGGTLYSFAGVSGISNGLRMTLGSVNLSQTPLPVELSRFEAVVISGNTVMVKWQTLSELNNNYFEVERSKSGENWESIEHVQGAGNSTSLIDYVITDNRPFEGISYYRLKQSDYDGTISYSEIRSVNLNENNQEVLIYPNPTMQEFWIEGDGNEISKIQLFDSKGMDVSSLIRVRYSSRQKALVNLNGLPSGLYFACTATQRFRIFKKG
ncbi:MAG: T9SS type A sorting domain-containing protein [Bacteroidota bacterium]